MKPIHERRRRSAREIFGQCRFRYAAEYVHGIDSGNNVTRRGSTFHKAREIYIRSLWSSRQTEDFELASAAMTQALAELPLPYAEELDCVNLWLRFSERFSLPLASYFACETELQMFSTFLRFDLVLVPNKSTLRIDDAKTNWSIPSDAALESAYQPAFYLAAARLLFPGFTRYEFHYDFVRFNASRIVTKTDAELDAFEESIVAQDQAMDAADATGAFPATGGSHCGVCMVKNCPVVDNALRYSGRILGTDDAAATIREAAALHRALEVRQDALRGYCSMTGPTQAGGIEWNHRPVERSVYPAQAVLDVLESNGVEFRLHFSGSAVKPLITSKKKYRGAVEDGIKALAVTHTSTRFGPKTVVESDEREYQESDE